MTIKVSNNTDLTNEMNKYIDTYLGDLEWQNEKIVEALNNYMRNLFSILSIQAALDRMNTENLKKSAKNQFEEYKIILDQVKENINKEHVRRILLDYYNRHKTANEFFEEIKKQFKT